MGGSGRKSNRAERQQILRIAASRRKQFGDVVQLVRMLPCHGRGRGFEPRRPRHIPKDLQGMWPRNERAKKGTFARISRYKFLQQRERLPTMGAFFICANFSRRR